MHIGTQVHIHRYPVRVCTWVICLCTSCPHTQGHILLYSHVPHMYTGDLCSHPIHTHRYIDLHTSCSCVHKCLGGFVYTRAWGVYTFCAHVDGCLHTLTPCCTRTHTTSYVHGYTCVWAHFPELRLGASLGTRLAQRGVHIWWFSLPPHPTPGRQPLSVSPGRRSLALLGELCLCSRRQQGCAAAGTPLLRG